MLVNCAAGEETPSTIIVAAQLLIRLITRRMAGGPGFSFTVTDCFGFVRDAYRLLFRQLADCLSKNLSVLIDVRRRRRLAHERHVMEGRKQHTPIQCK